MGGKIAFILIAIIILGVALYIYNSGVLGQGLSYLSSIGPHGANPYTQSSPSGGGTTILSAPSSSVPTNPNLANIPTGFTASQLSPYFEEVRFGGFSPGNGYSYGQISFYANLPAGLQSIDVTGWLIKGNRGGEYVPQAVNLYDPLGLTPESDIWLKSGDSLYLYSSSAPVNLRLNECIGYLPNKTQFTPSLPETCPYIDRSQINSFTGACQNYITSLGGCQEADLSNPAIPTNDYACRTYIENNFNYRACFEAHEDDPNFLSNQVWAWTGSTPFDPYHDNIELLDQHGLIVDTYSY